MNELEYSRLTLFINGKSVNTIIFLFTLEMRLLMAALMSFSLFSAKRCSWVTACRRPLYDTFALNLKELTILLLHINI